MQVDLAFLLKAIKEQVPIDIYYKEKNRTWNYISRFLRLESEEQVIVIDLPQMKDETYKPLEVGYMIYIAFNLAGFRFQFKTKVKKKIGYKLDKQRSVPALGIVWPDEILNGNRRSLFRIQFVMDDLIMVNYKIMGEGESENAQDSEPGEYEGVEEILMDISQRGLAIKINRRVNINVGDKLKLRFHLGKKEDVVEIIGIVRHIRKHEGTPVHVCGIEFVSTDSKMNKRSLRKIAFYIMSRKQENIKFYSVTTIVSKKNPVVQKIVSGEANEELLNMLFSKELKLSSQEYLESLVYVLKIEKYKKRALSFLKSIPVRFKEKYIQRIDTNHRVAQYILSEALDNHNLDIVEAVINNQYLPVEFWMKIARQGIVEMLKILLENKNKLIGCPEIMSGMEKNLNVTDPILKKIRYIKESYLVGLEPEPIPEEGVIDEVTEEIKKEKAENSEDEKKFTTSEIKEELLTILQKINKMSVRERVQLAFSGGKSERMILAKDPSKFVGLSLVESPRIGEDEICEILKNKGISGEVVKKVSDNKNWMRNYSIMFSVLKHPKVPVKKASTYLKRVKTIDLRKMAKDKDINPTIRAIVLSIIQKEG